ncbi:MAG: hypothetical protein K2M46_11345 [Lachnospiraceae bacterium]|nr:hypothetical protein [Lachnospiraceae bacterium]
MYDVKDLNLCFDIYHSYEKVGRIEIVNNVLKKNEVINPDLWVHPFPNSKTLEQILGALKQRILCPERCTPDMLASMGLTEYNVYDILKNTHGVDSDDFVWFKFDGENITWDDVRVR